MVGVCDYGQVHQGAVVPWARRRVLRALVVALVSVALVVTPCRKAEAVFVVPVLVGAALVFDSGTLAASYAAAAAAITAGAALLSWKLKDSGGAEVMNVRVNPKAAQRVPSGWTAGSPASAAPVPPGTAGSIVTSYYYTYGTGQNQTTYTTCQAAVVAWFGAGHTCIVNTGHSICIASADNCDATNNTGVITNNVTTCPSGYSLSGGTCNLTNAAIVVKPSDNIADADGTGSTVAFDPYDPDTSSVPASVQVAGDNKSITVTDSNGTVKQRMTWNNDGTLTWENWTGNGNGTSNYERLDFGAANSGAANGGRVATGGAKQIVVGEGSTTGNTTAATAPCTDCAKESTLQSVKTGVDSLVNDGVKVNEQASSWSGSKSASDTAQSNATSAFDDHKSKLDAIKAGGNSSGLGVEGLANYTPPSSPDATGYGALIPASSSCSPLSVTVHGHTSSVDICTIANATRSILEWGLYAMTFLYVLFAFYRREEKP